MSEAGSLAGEIRTRLGPAPARAEWPLVSIVVLNRNGAEHLRRLLDGLVKRTDYPDMELILVDNGSTDESLDLIRAFEAPFPISIVANRHNESFADANNQGAELAGGALLLFLNNDIEPFEEGWLRELVACREETGAGAVGSTLICPDDRGSAPAGFRVQTQQIKLQVEPDRLRMDRTGERRELFDDSFGEDLPSVALIGAALLLERDLHREVGGFTHGYFYGGEDEDLSLELRERGHSTLYSGRSVLIHHVSSTTRTLLSGPGRAIRNANSRLLLRRWGARAWREGMLGRLEGGGAWAGPGAPPGVGEHSPAAVRELSFCVEADRLGRQGENVLAALTAELERRGLRHTVLRDDDVCDSQSCLYDVIVHIRGGARYVPSPTQLNVLWVAEELDPAAEAECRLYDLVVTEDAEIAERLRKRGNMPVVGQGERAARKLLDAAPARMRELALQMQVDPVEGVA